MNVNVDLMEENVIQINGGTTINVDVSVKKRLVREKNVLYVRKIIFRILLHVVVKTENI